MLASKLIQYFSSHPVAFGFQSSSPPDNITLNPADKKTDQSLSDFQNGNGVAALATLDMKPLMSCNRTTLVDTISSLQDSDGVVLPVAEVHELLRLMTFWIMTNPSGLGIQLVFYSYSLFLLPSSVVKYRLHNIPFFMIVRTLFLSLKLAFMAALTGL